MCPPDRTSNMSSSLPRNILTDVVTRSHREESGLKIRSEEVKNQVISCLPWGTDIGTKRIEKLDLDQVEVQFVTAFCSGKDQHVRLQTFWKEVWNVSQI